MDNTKKQIRIEKASELFHKGYNCAQSVAGAFAKDVGVDEQTMFRLSSSFGGGMGRTRGVCGAVSAMCIIAGLAKGYSSPDEPTKKNEHYALIQKLIGKFKKQYEYIECRQLLRGLSAAADDSPSSPARDDDFYKNRPCEKILRCAADIICDEIF